MIGTHGAAFFAALNTGSGFVPYFREIFDKIGTVYVIKGGSGTGKSRFMREISEKAEELGYGVQYFLCSSDQTSLDGIIIDELDTAILDGTAPHVHEPTLIGARERFIDLSVFLNTESLREQKGYIETLQTEKSLEYAKIYKYLKISSLYRDMLTGILQKSLLEEKMDKAISKIIRGVESDGEAKKLVRIRSSVGCEGNVTLDTYRKFGEIHYEISDFYGLGELFLKKLLSATDKMRVSAMLSYSLYCPDMPDAIYYPYSGVTFYTRQEGDDGHNLINMRRFVCDKTLRAHKAEMRAISRLRRDAESCMQESFARVKGLHAELEKIYSGAMDFGKKEKFTESFKKELFK